MARHKFSRTAHLVFYLLAAVSWALNSNSPLAEENNRGGNEARAAAIEAQEQSIARTVMSPFCPGRTLADCPSSTASQLRAKLREMLAQGRSEQEVQDFLLATYGEEIRAAPKKEGFGLLAWVMPAAFLLLGLFVMYLWLFRHNVQESEPADVQSGLSPELKARIEAEVGTE
ncbi:MAG: cytochrome c-type biogenesis protein CcmH [Deltaproteobacteria bacterium]|nr:cytochrome c-type biogenesis protein CcmH [Deltaproteobacteria bacterium]